MDQLSLFGGEESRDLVRGVPPSERHAVIATRLPHHLYMGTSSWSFPGWEGLVYERAATQSVLARHGLKAYASHPLLRCVGVDRTFYRPIPPEEFAAYADAVPDHFRFVVKAHQDLTRAYARPTSPGAKPQRNETFLDAIYAVDEVVEPCVEGLGDKLGVLLFQFPPQSLSTLEDRAGFLDRLHRFLGRLPKGPVYAVELRNSEILGPVYFRALRDVGACHCYNVHPSMPALEEQLHFSDPTSFPLLFVRWMLRRGSTYQEAREAFAPFDRLVGEDRSSRRVIASMCRTAIAGGRPAYVVVNNKAEGSAPLSVFRLAEELAEDE